MPSVQTSGLGGTSKIWGGGFAPFEKNDFHNWPINYDDLLPFYKEVSSFFNFDFLKFKTKNHNENIRSQIDHIKFDKLKFVNKWFLIPLPIIRLKYYYEKWEKEGKIEIVFDEINESLIANLKDPSYSSLMKNAIDFSDALIIGSQIIPDEVSDHLKSSKKPVLDYQTRETFSEAYTDFYMNKVLN